MNKNQIRFLAVIALIFVVFSVIAFAPPFVMTGAFWIAYLFGVISVLAQVIVMKTAFDRGKDVRSKFYGFPIAGIGIAYMAVQLVLSVIFMILAAIVPTWIEIVVFVVLLAVAAIGLISADTVRDEIEKQDRKLEENTSCMVTLRSIVYSLPGQCESETEKKALEELSDEFRYSDPISSAELEEVESQLEKEVAELQIAVSEIKTENIIPLCKKINNTLSERNRLCKLSK